MLSLISPILYSYFNVKTGIKRFILAYPINLFIKSYDFALTFEKGLGLSFLVFLMRQRSAMRDFSWKRLKKRSRWADRPSLKAS